MAHYRLMIDEPDVGYEEEATNIEVADGEDDLSSDDDDEELLRLMSNNTHIPKNLPYTRFT